MRRLPTVGLALAGNVLSATLGFDVDVSNPLSVPLPLVDAAFELASSGTAGAGTPRISNPVS